MSRDERKEIKILERIEEDLDTLVKKRLAVVKIRFSKGDDMAQGPVVLTVGQKTKATVVGFDQFGVQWTGVVPPVTWTLDNPTFDSSTPDGSNGDDIVSLAPGVANLHAGLTTAEGLAIGDTETITNNAVVQTPVLTTVKIDFSTPA